HRACLKTYDIQRFRNYRTYIKSTWCRRLYPSYPDTGTIDPYPTPQKRPARLCPDRHWKNGSICYPDPAAAFFGQTERKGPPTDQGPRGYPYQGTGHTDRRKFYRLWAIYRNKEYRDLWGRKTRCPNTGGPERCGYPCSYTG